MGSDVTGFIGLAGDEDWYAFCPPADGIVNIHVDFTDSYNAMGINWMLFAAYTDEFPASNVSVASSEYDGTPFVMHPLTRADHIDVQMSVMASVGRYAFKRRLWRRRVLPRFRPGKSIYVQRDDGSGR